MHSICSGVLGLLCRSQTQILQPQQILAQLRSRSLRGRTRIVQLMHQPRCQRSQRHQLFSVQRFCLVRLQPRSPYPSSTTLRASGQQAINAQN